MKKLFNKLNENLKIIKLKESEISEEELKETETKLIYNNLLEETEKKVNIKED